MALKDNIDGGMSVLAFFSRYNRRANKMIWVLDILTLEAFRVVAHLPIGLTLDATRAC